jgi:hypothetical protein
VDGALEVGKEFRLTDKKERAGFLEVLAGLVDRANEKYGCGDDDVMAKSWRF